MTAWGAEHVAGVLAEHRHTWQLKPEYATTSNDADDPVPEFGV